MEDDTFARMFEILFELSWSSSILRWASISCDSKIRVSLLSINSSTLSLTSTTETGEVRENFKALFHGFSYNSQQRQSQ